MAARSGSARLDRWDALLLLAGAAAVLLFLAAERRIAGAWGLPLDDGWIHLRLARNLAPDAINEEISGVPAGPLSLDVHANFPHHWDVICMALRSVVDHAAPAPAMACSGLTHP